MKKFQFEYDVRKRVTITIEAATRAVAQKAADQMVEQLAQSPDLLTEADSTDIEPVEDEE